MTSINATTLRKNLYSIISQVNENCSPVTITNSHGKGAVLIGEDEWSSIEETLFLNGVPQLAERLTAQNNDDMHETVSEDELEW